MAETLLPGVIHRTSEFVQGLTGACGPNVLAMAQSWSLQTSSADVYAAYTFMRGKGLCDATGASTLDGVRVAAQLLGFTIPAYRGYAEPWADWRDFYLSHVGSSFIIMQTANGQALKDSISGLGENATNLQYHFIGVVGHFDGGFSAVGQRTLPAGWWCVDGDSLAGGNTYANNFKAADMLQFYPDDVLAAAQPCGAFTLQGKAQGTTVSYTQHTDIDRWQDNTTGNLIGTGIYNYVLAHNITQPCVLGEETYDTSSPNTVAIFSDATTDRIVAWDKTSHSGNEVWSGRVALAYRARAVSAEQKLMAANTQIAQLQQQVTAANAQITQLQQQLQSAQGTSQSDPKALAALQIIQQLKTVLAQM